MLAQLIQAMYNIVDSFFVGKYSGIALTALSVIYPLQLIIIALAVGTGVGVNTYMARQYAQDAPEKAEEAAGSGILLSLGTWLFFAILSAIFMYAYVRTSAKTPAAIADALTYGRIVCIGSIGVFLEGTWTKVHQSRGNMFRPMFAQIAGALTNIVLDPILIFGIGPLPEMGVAGAAWATVCGQIVAAFPILGSRFVPAVFSLMTSVFFQAIGNGKISLFLSVMRQLLCLVPIFWLLSLMGLRFTWLAFPISEFIVSGSGMTLYWRTILKWRRSGGSTRG